MLDYIQPYLDYFTANPEWALVIIFLIALGEALLIIGLFVPSTAVLVGAGVLVGTGHLHFWPVIIASVASSASSRSSDSATGAALASARSAQPLRPSTCSSRAVRPISPAAA